MADRKSQPAPPPVSPEREARLAAALRTNLRRRKAIADTPSETPPESDQA